jgi:hypothetical protein
VVISARDHSRWVLEHLNAATYADADAQDKFSRDAATPVTTNSVLGGLAVTWWT